MRGLAIFAGPLLFSMRVKASALFSFPYGRSSVSAVLLIATLSLTAAQTPPRRAPVVDPTKTAGLLETGHCPEGLKLVKKAYAGTSDGDLKRRIGAGGIRCAMALNDV